MSFVLTCLFGTFLVAVAIPVAVAAVALGRDWSRPKNHVTVAHLLDLRIEGYERSEDDEIADRHSW